MRRRIFGGVCLVSALVMLLAGETIFQNRLSPVAFIIYWLACLVMTTLAIGAAMVDLIRLRAESRKSQRELIEETVREVEMEKLRRKKQADSSTHEKN